MSSSRWNGNFKASTPKKQHKNNFSFGPKRLIKINLQVFLIKEYNIYKNTIYRNINQFYIFRYLFIINKKKLNVKKIFLSNY